MEDRRKLIAALVEKTGVKLDPHDPAFLLVELNLLMLENAGSDAGAVLEKQTAAFKAAAMASTDDLISTINQTLALYKERTLELQNTVQALQALPPPAPPPVQPPAPKAQPKGLLAAGGLVLFALGALCGLAVNFLF